MKYKVYILVSCSLLTVNHAIRAQRVKYDKPNVIFILMDDLGYGDIHCFGQEKIETPNIDKLQENGMKFTQFYSGSPISAPSRCVLMTGLHSGHSQIRGNDEMETRGAVTNYDSMFVHKELEGQYPLKKGTITLGRLMQKSGYVTGCFGKWGLGYPNSDGTPIKQGFNRFYGYNCQRQAHTYYPAFLYDDENRVYLNNKVADPHIEKLDSLANPNDMASYAKFSQKEYSNDLIFNALMNFVDQNKNNHFFVMWTTPLPHVSLQAPIYWVNHYINKFGNEKPYLGQKGYFPCRYPHATYAAMITYFDAQIGLLVEKLKENGLYDNTMIVFTSDNGPAFTGGVDPCWFNSGGLFKSEYGWGKCFLHEGGIRVPTIVCWKGVVQPSSISKNIFGFQDFMPTFADIIHQPCPTTDGISFLPTLLGSNKNQKKHSYLYWEFNQINGEKAIRMGHWKGLLSNIKGGNKNIQLFNLKKDVKEEYDVSKKHPLIIKKMEQIMKEAHSVPQNSKFDI